MILRQQEKNNTYGTVTLNMERPVYFILICYMIIVFKVPMTPKTHYTLIETLEIAYLDGNRTKVSKLFFNELSAVK